MADVDDSVQFALIALLGLNGCPTEDLAQLRRVQQSIARLQVKEVQAAREEGFSWDEIGRALEVSELVARERFERRAPW